MYFCDTKYIIAQQIPIHHEKLICTALVASCTLAGNCTAEASAQQHRRHRQGNDT